MSVEASGRSGQRWISTDADPAASISTAALIASSREPALPPAIIKHNKTHAQLVEHYSEYYHRWNELSSAASLIKASIADRKEVERQERWANYYAANSAALAHYHLALSKGREPIGNVSARPESPPMPPQMASNESEVERMETNELADGNASAASDTAKYNDNRKRKEIVIHSHADLGDGLGGNKSPTNATISKKMKNTQDNNIIVAPTITSPVIRTQSTEARGSFTQAPGLQKVIHTPSSLPASNAKSNLNLSSVATFGQKKQEGAEVEKRNGMHHVGKVRFRKCTGSADDNENNMVYHAQQMLNPDIHMATTAMMTKRNRKKKKMKPSNERVQREAVHIRDASHPVIRWTIAMVLVPLFVVVMSLSSILAAPSTTAYLPPLLLSLAIVITLLPLVVLVLLTPTATATEEATPNNPINNTPTLREFLSHPDGFHMSFAPAFFGFFAYFGCLDALEEMTNGRIVPKAATAVGAMPTTTSTTSETTTASTSTTSCGLQSVSGASAGAMAAVMLAAGIQPRIAAQFASTFTWKMIADPPGWGGYVRGDNFEQVMRRFILEAGTRRYTTNIAKTTTTANNNDIVNALAKPIQLEEALVPVAVSAFDLLRMKGMNMTTGCMAKAARCSAGFPGLFQPVAWRAESNDEGMKASFLPDSLLIDGGITDNLGLNGLRETTTTSTKKKTKRVINMMVGDFGFRGPRGLKTLPPGVNAEYLVSIAIIGTPLCGPWAMQNGPRAVESARKAMAAILDLPMERGTCDNHFVVRVEASKWLE